MNSSILCSLRNPSAALARQIEDTFLDGADSNNLLVKGSCWAVARLVSAAVFPVFLTLELVFKKVPEMMIYRFTPQFQCVSDEAMKFLLAIIPSMLFGLYAPVGMPGFFLQRTVNLQQVLPFGVERSFGTTLSRPIECPTNAEDTQQAIQSQQQVSVIGEGMSQGWQTIPINSDQCVIHTRKLKQITVDIDRNTVTVGAGVSWEELQITLDRLGKSSIVKQASDVFSIGGSIGINCHGWAHQKGAIVKTVMSLKIIDAQGRIRILPRPRDDVPLENLSDEEQLFKCMFGTMGYFGVIVEATLQIVDNEVLMGDVRQADTRQFEELYQTIEHDPSIPLFGGRLSLDAIQGNPLREVAMLSYRKTAAQGVIAQRRIELEPVRGTRISRKRGKEKIEYIHE
ncbi:MAG: FAD-binding protein [Chlamydiia bacterium]